MAEVQVRSLTDGSVGKHMTRMAIPMFFGISSMMISALVDAIYVGQLGTKELAAVSLTFPIFMGMTSVAMGLGIGATSVVSRMLGSGDHSKGLKICNHTILLTLILIGVVLILGFTTMNGIYSLLGADPELHPWAVRYTEILLLGLPFFAISMIGSMMLRSMGDIKTAAVIMIVASIVQVLIAPVLIFGIGSWEGIGLYGSAWAFVISRFVLFFYAIVRFRSYGLFQQIGSWSEVLSSWAEILRLGLPSMSSQLIHPISMGILLGILATFGTATVAAFGVVTRIEGLAMMVLMAVASSLGPVIGQNFGAKRFDRVRHAVRLAYRFSMLYGVGIAIVLFIFADPIVSVFRDDPEVIEVGIVFLMVVPVTLGVAGIGALSGSIFVAYGEALPSFVLSLLRSIVVLVPVVLVFKQLWGYVGVFIGIAVTNVIVGGAAFIWLQYSTKKHVESGKVPEKPQNL
ncbi:MAG: MATE family efflux transporter, partial [Gammaproteobacteria bacterium]|nr:MATE family efflux transporter [Gammaproteobacteria bacterium]